jgi:hypothetical protein
VIQKLVYFLVFNLALASVSVNRAFRTESLCLYCTFCQALLFQSPLLAAFPYAKEKIAFGQHFKPVLVGYLCVHLLTNSGFYCSKYTTECRSCN